MLTATLLALTLTAQIDVPTAGAVYNAQTAAIHTVNGIPGAATLSAPKLTGIQSAALSADGTQAIVTKEGRLYLAAKLNTELPELTDLEIEATTSQVAWGTTTAILYANGTFTKLDHTLLTPGQPQGEVTAMEYDEANQRLYIAVVAEQDGGLYTYDLQKGELNKRIATPNPRDIARTRDHLYVLDTKTNQILTAEGKAIEGEFTAIAASQIPNRLYAATKESIKVYDNAEPVTELQAKPTRLTKVGKSFLINEDQPSYILKDDEAPALYFIPATRSQQ